MTTDLIADTDATIGQPFTLTYVLNVPVSTVASPMILEALAPVNNNIPTFSICSMKVTYVGDNMPCLDPSSLVTEFSSKDTTGASSEPDRAVVDLGNELTYFFSKYR